MMMKIFYNYLVNNLESTFSDFIQTGNEINLKFDENGYRLTLSLFTDLTEKVFDKLLKLIFSPNIDESNYNQLYQMTQEDVKSSNEFQPFKKTHNSFFKIVKYNVTSILDLIKLQNIKYDKFKSFLKVAINSFSINSLFFGYLKEENLNKIINKIQSNLENSTSLTSVTTANLIDYLHAHKVIYKPVIFRTKNDLKTEKNHAIENFYQVGLKDYKTSLMMNIIEMIWGNMFYYYLRTLKQLGYIVNANKEFIDNNMYFVFIVQGSKKNPSEMNLEIDNIIWRLRDKIITLPRDKLQEVIGSIKNEILKKDTNLKERSKRLWMEIYQNTIDFSRKDKLLIEIDKLVKSDIIEAFDSIFIDRPQKLSIQLYSPSSNILKLEKEEAYYLNANIKYNVTSDVKILDNMQDTATTDD
jgi:secreted Zn-dependent insulinase-like peptidase